MCKIPTLYSDYQECILDLDIYGKIVATPQQSIDDLTKALFEEFKRRKPMPTLEYKRYELSRLVSPDYRIAYNKELELQDNESLVELKNTKSTFEKIDFEDLSSLIPEVQEAFSYEMNITDSLRRSIIDKYDLETGEEFKPGVRQTENIVGSVKEDTELILSDEKIENLGVDIEEANVNSYLDDSDEESFDNLDNNQDIDSSDEDSDIDDYSQYEYDSEDENNSDDIDDYSQYENEEEYEDNLDDTDDYSQYEDNSEDETTELDEIYENSDDEDTYEEDEELDDYSQYENDSEDDNLDDYDDYSQYSDDSEDENNSEDETEDTVNDSEDEFEDITSDYEDIVDDSSQYEYDSENEENSDNYNQYKGNSVDEVKDESDSIDLDDIQFIDSVLDEPDFSDYVEPVVKKEVNIPVTPAQIHNEIKTNEVIDRSAEPTDIRAFLRKHPRCDYEFALKYFTKKQINDAIKIGKIIKKGNILKI